MSNQDQQIYESLNKRKLLQTTVNASVIVSQMVVVNKKGTGNFTTINDAVAAAPNNTAIGSGYFVIYVVKGLYHEYVSIPKNKQNIMMIGDGIGNTVITGNRSVVDGWTTFSSATFAVVGRGFVAVNITFRNTAGAIKQQAVAVRNGADICFPELQNCFKTSTGWPVQYRNSTRPWKEYSRTIFMQSYIASLIDPAGWAPWNGDFALATLYYAEFNNTGAGSKTSNRVTWPGYHLINATDAANFTLSISHKETFGCRQPECLTLVV
ncbi:hypothetical protein GH714_005665 [Hevea brasiliensis]|uniref:Pectinesterase catalytic domain-containing protein n=1 Tax=Hevea brasiliensis TaxID=3981 RepID=A0A6A6MBQ3_HEVBR|nr:hypothetical protein GH714_005665 [Hevea brasiliensis]